LDSFCGCGTSLAVAQMLGRHWIGIDISPTAIKLVEKRLNKLGAKKDETYVTINTPTTDNDLKAFKPFEKKQCFFTRLVNELLTFLYNIFSFVYKQECLKP